MPLSWGELGPHLTVWLGLRPTSIPSGILIHLTVWPQCTHQRVRQTDRTDRQTYRHRSDSIWRTVLQTVAQSRLNRSRCCFGLGLEWAQGCVTSGAHWRRSINQSINQSINVTNSEKSTLSSKRLYVPEETTQLCYQVKHFICHKHDY